jgi:hypothetical protein
MDPLKTSTIELEDEEAIYELVMERGWGDGFPVMPPTRERVLRMLDGRDPARSLGPVPPLNEEATLERIAINAVMAGCKPDYFPVVLAAIEAMLDPAFNFRGVQITTNPAAPMVVVNGPVRKKIGIACGTGCMGPGWRANATIGRTLRLISLSLGGAVPGTVSKCVMGLPERYSFCWGEDEENSPWSPFHTERGFDAADSAVTLIAIDELVLTHSASFYDRAERLTDVAAMIFAHSGHAMNTFHAGQPTLVIPAPAAREMAKQGVTKPFLREQVFAKSRLRVEDAPEVELFKRRGFPHKQPVDGYIQPCNGPEDVLVMVAGGDVPSYAAVLPTFYMSRAVSRGVKES